MLVRLGNQRIFLMGNFLSRRPRKYHPPIVRRGNHCICLTEAFLSRKPILHHHPRISCQCCSSLGCVRLLLGAARCAAAGAAGRAAADALQQFH
eukprot:16441239-Heterocapsa_arctica.AAC.1